MKQNNITHDLNDMLKFVPGYAMLNYRKTSLALIYRKLFIYIDQLFQNSEAILNKNVLC